MFVLTSKSISLLEVIENIVLHLYCVLSVFVINWLQSFIVCKLNGFWKHYTGALKTFSRICRSEYTLDQMLNNWIFLYELKLGVHGHL